MSLIELGVVAIVLVASYGITARLSIPEAPLNIIDRDAQLEMTFARLT